MLYELKVDALVKEKNLEYEIVPLSRTMVVSDAKGHTIELSYSIVEKLDSKQIYELLRAVF